MTPRHVAATSLVGLPVTVGVKRVGAVEVLVADMVSGDLAFVAVGLRDADGKRGTRCWVPWRSCRFEHGGVSINARVPGGDLTKAPVQPSATLTDPIYRAKLYEFFQIQPPAFDWR